MERNNKLFAITDDNDLYINNIEKTHNLDQSKDPQQITQNNFGISNQRLNNRQEITEMNQTPRAYNNRTEIMERNQSPLGYNHSPRQENYIDLDNELNKVLNDTVENDKDLNDIDITDICQPTQKQIKYTYNDEYTKNNTENELKLTPRKMNDGRPDNVPPLCNYDQFLRNSLTQKKLFHDKNVHSFNFGLV